MSYEKIYAMLTPCPIEDQIKEIEREIVIVGRITDDQVARNKLHPNMKAQRMNRLRSILVTLRNVRDQQLATQEATT